MSCDKALRILQQRSEGKCSVLSIDFFFFFLKIGISQIREGIKKLVELDLHK